MLIEQGRDDAAQVAAGGLLGFGGAAPGDCVDDRQVLARHSHVAILKIFNKIVNNLSRELGDHRRRAG